MAAEGSLAAQGKRVDQQPPLKLWEIKFHRIVLTGRSRQQERPRPPFSSANPAKADPGQGRLQARLTLITESPSLRSTFRSRSNSGHWRVRGH